LVEIVNIDDTASAADGGNVAKYEPLLLADAPTPRNSVLAWRMQLAETTRLPTERLS